MEDLVNVEMENAALYIAVYGAVVSTGVLMWDVVKYRRDRARIEVKANIRILLGGLASQTKIGIDVINRGTRPITLAATGFELFTVPSEPSMVTQIDTSLPKEIGEGQSHTTFIDYDAVNITQIKNAWARDATGRVYLSKIKPLIG